MLEQLHLGMEPQEHLWHPVRNINFVKPTGGLWTSTFLPDGSSDWIRWCISEEFLNPDTMGKWILTPAKGARIFTVNQPDDIAFLCNGQATYNAFATPDFEALAQDWDGIHLTKDGQYRTRFSMPFSFYGWDCESTLWLNWAFDDVKPRMGTR